MPTVNDKNTIFVKSEEPETIIPIDVPNGVAHENIINKIYTVIDLSLKFLLILIPKDIASHHLCNAIAKAKVQNSEVVFDSPTAIPSNVE